VFQGRVLCNGKVVPGAEIEIEYMNHQPLLDKNAFSPEANAQGPQDAFVLQTIFADSNGVFTFGIPKPAGGALRPSIWTLPNKYKGKKCSRDAVIWIKAVDMK